MSIAKIKKVLKFEINLLIYEIYPKFIDFFLLDRYNDSYLNSVAVKGFR